MRNPLDICTHRLPVILRDLRGCNCGGPRDSYGCGHWSNEMAECVTVPLTARQVKKYGEVTACMNCAAYEPSGVVSRASAQVAPRPRPADERTLRGGNRIATERQKRLERQKAQEIQNDSLATTTEVVTPSVE